MKITGGKVFDLENGFVERDVCFLNTGNRGVHLALHVAGIIVAAVMENAFIVH